MKSCEGTVKTENDINSPEHDGVLMKWTNYISGWQNRYITLKGCIMSYYRSQKEVDIGCRGSINISKAEIIIQHSDEYRFDVAVNECIWYLRAKSLEEKQQWIDKLRTFQTISSAAAEPLETPSGTSDPCTLQCLKEKVTDLETLRELLGSQTTALQNYLKSKIEQGEQCYDNASKEKVKSSFDLKEEVKALNVISSEILEVLTNSIKIFKEKEKLWNRKMEENQWHILKLEEICRALIEENLSNSNVENLESKSSPSVEEFHDAVDHMFSEEGAISGDGSRGNKEEMEHPLWPEIERITQQQLHYAVLDVGECSWQMFFSEGDMRMYRREEEINGIVTDPIKACHVVHGVTGREVCHYFFRPEFRLDWETTVEKMEVVENISDNTIVYLQVHKRTWPVTQRDSLFWSHMAHIPDPQDHDGQDIWVVVNHSTKLPHYPPETSKCIRINMTVCLYCQTFVSPPKNDAVITRQDIRCYLTYCSNINPGGWVPAAALRAVYKKEYPKFLNRFSAYVRFQTEANPILF